MHEGGDKKIDNNNNNKTVRVNVCKKGTTSKKPIIVSSWEQLMTSAAMKLNMKYGGKRILVASNARGERLNEFDQIQEDAVIYLSIK